VCSSDLTVPAKAPRQKPPVVTPAGYTRQGHVAVRSRPVAALLCTMAGPMSPPIQPEDLYRFRWLDHVRLSPDGERVAYQVGWADAEARDNRGVVVVQRVGPGSEPSVIAGSDRRCHSPQWSPDG